MSHHRPSHSQSGDGAPQIRSRSSVARSWWRSRNTYWGARHCNTPGGHIEVKCLFDSNVLHDFSQHTSLHVGQLRSQAPFRRRGCASGPFRIGFPQAPGRTGARRNWQRKRISATERVALQEFQIRRALECPDGHVWARMDLRAQSRGAGPSSLRRTG